MKIETTGKPGDEIINMLIYGPSGNGKTRFSGTCKSCAQPLILSAESGLLSLNALGEFDVIKIETWDQITEARRFLREEKHPYKTVIIDSGTEIQTICMNKILADEKVEKARIQDFGSLYNKMTGFIRDFRDMRLNLIMTALSDTISDEESGVMRAVPLFQGKLKETAAAYFDLVVYIHAKAVKGADGKSTIKRMLQTQGTERILAKDRSGKLPLFVEPDFCSIYQRIFSKSIPSAPININQKETESREATIQ